MIQFKHVTKIYADAAILRDFSADIAQGEFVFISGPSGSGKSTLLRLLFCSEWPDMGLIMFQGNDISTLKKSRIPYIRRSIGFVFQDARLLTGRTVYDNIELALRVTGFPRRDRESRVIETLRLIGMESKVHTQARSLSGGEQQKVAIARAIVNTPAVLLADEPTGNIDIESAWEIFQIFNMINSSGTTVVIATHNYDLIQRMRKRVIPLGKPELDTLKFRQIQN